MFNIVIIGAGIAGLSAAYHLKQRGYSPIVLERSNTYGGLCDSFEIDGFIFDRFIHLSFTANDYVKNTFEKSAHSIVHSPNPHNLYNGLWLKHPVQNNLFPLTDKEKTEIIVGFKHRKLKEPHLIRNYEEWLRVQYGDTFAEKFPLVYTRKYWCQEANQLETKWIGDRMYLPSLDEVLFGAENSVTPITYYAKEMRYPEKGGYKAYLANLVDELDIRYVKEVVEIDLERFCVTCSDGENFIFGHLISSLPLPRLVEITKCIPERVIQSSRNLKWTSGYLISIGLNTTNIPPYLWFYVYDEDILPARVYSPSLKSPNNVPEGCSSLQLEVYCQEELYSRNELIEKSISKLILLDVIREEEILFVDVRFEKFANVIFDHNIYNSRKVVKDFFLEKNVDLIGRFGEWEYFWSDQSFLSGKNAVDHFL